MTWFREIADPQSLNRSRILGDLFQEKTDHIFERKANQQVYKRLVYFCKKAVQRKKNKNKDPNRKAKIYHKRAIFFITNQPALPANVPTLEAGLIAGLIKGNQQSQVSMDVGPLSAAGWRLSRDPAQPTSGWLPEVAKNVVIVGNGQDLYSAFVVNKT